MLKQLHIGKRRQDTRVYERVSLGVETDRKQIVCFRPKTKPCPYFVFGWNWSETEYIKAIFGRERNETSNANQSCRC